MKNPDGTEDRIIQLISYPYDVIRMLALTDSGKIYALYNSEIWKPFTREVQITTSHTQ